MKRKFLLKICFLIVFCCLFTLSGCFYSCGYTANIKALKKN